MFRISDAAVPESLIKPVPHAGALVTFVGVVRDVNEGRQVASLEYEAHVELAEREGVRILEEARERFGSLWAGCFHRVGHLEIGEVAIRVEVWAAHRKEAFAACAFIVDEVKARVPIWKKEHYREGDSGWINAAPDLKT